MQAPPSRLLLVDDDPSALQVMAHMLHPYADLRFATSGRHALDLARQQRPDLIVLDADMPGLSGFDTCRALRDDPVLADVPVIFATGADGPRFELDAFASGATDYVTKPLVPEQLRARVRAQLRRHGAPHAAGRQGRPALIVLVDDDDATRQALHALAEPLGEVHVAADGAAGLQLVQALQPDLVLVDLRMPGMDGFELCATIKSDPLLRQAAVVFVTQHGDTDVETRALDMGAADFVAKPFHSGTLRARLRNLLQGRQAANDRLAEAHAHWRRLGDARVAEIVRTAHDGIVSVDGDGLVVLANPAACALLGLDQPDLVGRPLAALLGCDPRQWTAVQQAQGVELCAGPAPGRPLEVTVALSGSGPDRLHTVVMRDLSERLRLRAEADARLRAEEHGRTKVLTAGFLAHEAGNALGGIEGLVDLMQPAAGQPWSDDQIAKLALLQRCARQARELLVDAVQLGRLQTGALPLTLQPVDLAPLVDDALALVAHAAQSGGLTLQGLPAGVQLPRVQADPARLQQVLLNLLGNAVKYSRRGGTVRVSATADDAAPARQVRLTIDDDGIGMTPQQLRQLFEPWNRLGRESLPGSGLGLSLSRQLLLAMGGQLLVRSRAREGTQVTLTLQQDDATP